MSELSEKYKSNVKLVRDLVGYEALTIEDFPYTSFQTMFKNVNGKEMMFKIICHYDSIRVVVVIEDETSVAQSGKYVTPEELTEHKQDIIDHNLWWVNEYNISVKRKEQK